MRAFVTGGTGFIGRALVRLLRSRGDEVVALARSPRAAEGLEAMGCELVEGGMDAPEAIERAARGADAVFHLAGVYRIGIRRSERPAMYEANVTGTERVLDAASAVGVPRIIHVSTINVFGNTRGRVVDETYRRDPAEGFLSYYDETKYRSHRVAEDRAASGAPVVIAQPGGVYGPGDHSEIGNMIERTATGRLPMRTFPELGMNMLHVDDAAEGILLAHDRGRTGQSYVVGGEITRAGELIDRVARLAGRRPPRWTLPPSLARMGIPFGPLATRLMGTPPNLREAIRAAHGVTYWATDSKARRELGYAPRDLDTGLRQTLAALLAT